MASAVVEKEAIQLGDAAAAIERKSPPGASSTQEKRSSFQDYIRIAHYGRPVDYLLGSIGILAAIGSGVAFAMVNLIIGDFISIMTDFTASGSAPDGFMSQVSKLYFVYIAIARFICTYVYSSLLTYTALRITRNLRYEYLKSALGQEVGYFDQGASVSISMQATSNGKLIQSGISEKLGQVFQAIATFFACFIIAFISQWKLTLILMSIVPALLIIVGIVGGLDAAIETKILKLYGQAGSFVETVLASIRTTKAFGLAPRMSDQYSNILHDARVLGDRKNALYSFMFGGEYFVIFAGMSLAFWQGISMLARGEVSKIGTIFTVLFSVILAASTLNSIAPHMVTFSRAATAAGELFQLIDRESRINPFDDSGDKPTTTQGSLELKDIVFSYPSRPDTRVLNGYSLSIPAGKVTALVGPSGSGKSTIIGLLERWYMPTSGSIELDGRSLEDLNLKWLRTNLRLVQQEPVLLNGTIYENICTGLVGTPWEHDCPEEKLRRVQTAAQTAFADGFIQALPQGYDTCVGERGSLLSGGQKQRIAIARSLISEPKVLLLDEATSALDPYAESAVQKALDAASKDRTTIVIAHKLKTIQNADNIVVMDRGSIIEQGRHSDLVARGGTYAKLVQAQDLSTASSDDTSDTCSEIADEDIVLAPTNSLQKGQSATDKLPTSTDLQDYDLHKGTGIFRTVLKLVGLVPEIRLWILLVAATCIVGAGVYPGQTILLGRVMDVLKADDMQKQGNFLALMFFVMALGLIIVYGILGWATNVVSQALFELMGFTIAIITMALVSVFVCGILSIAFSWKLGLVGVCAGIPPMLIGGYARIRLETKMDADMDANFSTSASLASETVTAIRTVSSLAIEQNVLRRYTSELDTAINRSRSPLFQIMIWFSLTQSIEYLILALGFWYGSKLVSENQITFYQFFVSFMGVYFSGQGAGQMFSFASSFTKANSAANYFFWLRDLEPTIQETTDNIDNAPADGCKSYDLKDLEFSYPLAPNNRVLKGLSLKIEPGQFVAFVGASGCGKSTMVSLLERFYDPTNGKITIDGTSSLADLNPRLYRANVSLVQQEPTLFPTSIRENIVMGVDQAYGDLVEDGVSDKMVEAACRAANAWDFVSSLPDGLGTPCGTGGSQLSGGQRQRIAIARALIRNPNVILLDEATSALDTESEKVVQAALIEAATSGNRITIAVAHRLSTIFHSDCIFVFHHGRIAEAGSHVDLIAQGGLYKKMSRLGEDQEWAKTANWFVGAWNTVKSWFGARYLVISSYSDWYRVGWGLGNDGSKPTSEWVARDFHITPYRLYKQQATFPYTFELGIRVSSMKPARTYEFATTELGIYTQTALWNGDWLVGFNDPSDEPRVVEIRTRND
ncbi:Leptomycin B resistance protein pmd1 [Fusarium oxysporum]|uniref:Leptomycin B resistance protein pmd1 n=1 Tax=Fusarium oxysporum TaxID=5507 RepID=A0A420R5E9_FUSOX|nr:Leptomycin B resistance protein pmd1 [Fusarium oxysporum]